MCGRYVLKTSSLDLKKELHLDEAPPLEARYNLAPMQAAPIVTSTSPRALTLARWGLLPAWAKDPRLASRLINARAESLEAKPIFRELLPHHRCLIPCDGFYEWRRDGQAHTPHYVHLAGGGLLTMAGLWSPWRSPDGLELATFTVVTTTANAVLAPLHDRMPVFLSGPARGRWLTGPALDEATLGELLVPWAGAPLEAYQVGPQVNSVGSDSPALLEPARVVQLELF
jgi:putative SOS response-associated peptidase YedK